MELLLIVPVKTQVSTFALKSISLRRWQMTLWSTSTKEDVGIKSHAMANNVNSKETGA